MRILITNDDGINAPGIIRLAEAAKSFGEVCVVAPKEQCSAMSHHITLRNDMKFMKYDFAAEGVEAFAVDGTPADCVRASFLGFLPAEKKPDLVLSGINEGSNCGFDIQYSATVGAAMEALLYKVPVICFSQGDRECRLHDREGVVLKEVCDRYLSELIKELSEEKAPEFSCWNVNFPNCSLEQCKGILYDRFPSQQAFWDDRYVTYKADDGDYIHMETEPIKAAEEQSDMKALLDGYISVGYVRNTVLR